MAPLSISDGPVNGLSVDNPKLRPVEQGFSSFLPALQLRCMYSSKTLNPTFENPWFTKDYNSAKRKGYLRKKFYAYMFSIISSPKYFFKVFFINLMNFCTHTSTTLYKQCIISFISILNRSVVQLSIFYDEKILEYTWVL